MFSDAFLGFGFKFNSKFNWWICLFQPHQFVHSNIYREENVRTRSVQGEAYSASFKDIIFFIG